MARAAWEGRGLECARRGTPRARARCAAANGCVSLGGLYTFWTYSTADGLIARHSFSSLRVHAGGRGHEGKGGARRRKAHREGR
eukprot:1966284-Prymnesium_polylepis.1